MRLDELTKVYFACTGNTCRSPLAQRIFMQHLQERDIERIEVGSRIADFECPTKSASSSKKSFSPEGTSLGTKAVVEQVYRDFNFPREHTPKVFTEDELRDADLVVVMTRIHRQNLVGYQGAWTEDGRLKVCTFGDLIGKPKLEVYDPYGSDELALFGRLPIELQKELEGASRGRRQVEVDYREHFSFEEEMGIRARAYMPTFDQLNSLVDRILDLKELPLKGISTILREDFCMKYDRMLSTATATKKFRTKSPRELCESGSFGSAMSRVAKDMSDVVKDLDGISRAYADLASQHPGFKVLAADFDDALYEKVMPGLLKNGTYLSDDWEVDREAIAREVLPNLMELAGIISNSLDDVDVNAGLAIKRLANEALYVTDEVTSKQFLETILGVSSK